MRLYPLCQTFLVPDRPSLNLYVEGRYMGQAQIVGPYTLVGPIPDPATAWRDEDPYAESVRRIFRKLLPAPCSRSANTANSWTWASGGPRSGFRQKGKARGPRPPYPRIS